MISESHRCRMMLVATVIAITWRGAPTVCGQINPPPLSEPAMERFADDLDLSDAQRAQAEAMAEGYREKYLLLWDDYVAVRRRYAIDLTLSNRPELDDSFDLSHLPLEEREEIERDRQAMQAGDPGVADLSGDQLDALNAHSEQVGVEYEKSERALRDSTLAKIRQMLAPEQVEHWPIAMRRLAINIEDQNPKNTRSPDDPRSRVDMLSLLAAATEKNGGELHLFADAIVTPDRVLAFEKENDALIDLAERVLAFEQTYRIALETYREHQRRHGLEWVNRMNAGDESGAAALERKKLDGLRRVWNLRMRLAEDLAAFAGEHLGEEARDAWWRRCLERFCPVLYLEESTDMLFEKAMAVEGVGEQQKAALRDLYETHRVWREAFKPRVARLEIEERCGKLWSDERDEGKATDRLEDAQQTRYDRAKLVYQQMRALLPFEHHAAFDGWWEAWQEEHSRLPYPPFLFVRP